MCEIIIVKIITKHESLSPLPWNHLNATASRCDNKGKVNYRQKQSPGDAL